MKTNRHNEMKDLLKQGIIELPDSDFNSTFMLNYIQEKSKTYLKPSSNYNILFILISSGLLILSLLFALNDFSGSFIDINIPVQDSTNILFLAFIVIVVYSLFVFVSDIIEEKEIKQKRMTHIAPR